MKWVLIALLYGQPAVFMEFNDSIEAASFKTRLFDYNRNKNYTGLISKGWHLPKDWASYNKIVTIKRKED